MLSSPSLLQFEVPDLNLNGLKCCKYFAGGKPSWTAKLLSNPELLCKKVREEAGELCQTLEENEGKERAASEAADLIYHAMVLLNSQVQSCTQCLIYNKLIQ
jgi:phosphoribosyl-ATP pyrophosphohydrolase